MTVTITVTIESGMIMNQTLVVRNLGREAAKSSLYDSVACGNEKVRSNRKCCLSFWLASETADGTAVGGWPDTRLISHLGTEKC